MKLVHFSDPHAGGPAEDWLAYIDKRWVGVFNYRFRRSGKHNLTRLKQAVSYILDTKPDLAVCTGDLTSTGQPGEFELVKPILQPLRDSAIPLLYVPGNHDCYVRHPKCVRAVNDMVAYLSKGDYQFGDLPIGREYGGVEFVLFNTSRPSNLLCSWGFVHKSDAQKVRQICEQNADKPRVLVNHYPLFEPHTLLRTRHRVFGEKPLRKLFAEGGFDLSLCGHVHKPYCQVDEQGRGENCAGSVTLNSAMSEIEWDGRKFNFRKIEV